MGERAYVAAIRARLKKGYLGTWIDAVAGDLTRRRYRPYTIRRYLVCCGHFAFWAKAEGIPSAEIDGGVARRFLDDHVPRCECPVATGGPMLFLRPALDHLLWQLAKQHIPAPAPRPRVRPDVVCEYEDYLRGTCGLAAPSIEVYVREVGYFLASVFGTGPIDLPRLTPHDLTTSVLQRAATGKMAATKMRVCALRNFVRYLQVSGLCDAKLTGAIPPVREWRLSRLPKALTEERVTALLAAYDRTTASGKGAYAMVLCLLRLGMRACEVAALRLDDIDWKRAVISITGKGRRIRELPLPDDVGRALVDYIRHARLPTTSRHVFVRTKMPRGEPMRSSSVQSAVADGWRRAGQKFAGMGTHSLRHTAATRLLRSGATLKEIADILGHGSLDTTVIYTKLDIDRLADVALPWPEP